MKKIWHIPFAGNFITLLIIVLLAFNLTAQVTHFIDPNQPDNNQVVNVTPATGMPVNDASVNSFAINGFSGSIDTITFGFTTKKIFIVNDASETDTLYISTDASFPIMNTRKYFFNEWRELSVAWQKCFIKFNYTGSLGRSYRFEAQ
jgi:hypothetical protein